ncbi:membrane protein, partial [Mycolicibacterium phlei DSM 43071]
MYDDDEEPRRFNLLTVISLIIAIVALGVAGWSLYKTQNSKPSYEPAQIADA